MICEVCKDRTAVFHVQQIMGGDLYEMHLCRECAAKKGISRDGKNFDFSLSKLISGLIKNTPLPEKSGIEADKCRTCGTKISNMKESGVVGCPDCYNTFRSNITNAISLNGKYIYHKGKLPIKLRAYKTILVDKEELKRELEEAVNNEEYENAVILRDKLAILDSGFQLND
ncbi:MAG: UvrB/UvrC motif-containing protein [Spirochaetales bacterium]|nr:UvrB/UvrC motif-containing protein [Spirochaetales bacterium]